MKLLPIVQYGLWIAAPVGQLTVAVAMVRRRAHRQFPWFFAYTIYHIVQAVAGMLILRRSYVAYFVYYWANEAVDALLTLAVIQEVFTRIFEQYRGLERVGRILFRCGVLVLLAIAIVSAALPAGRGASRLVAGLLVLDRSVGLVSCGLLCFLAVACHYLGLHWRQFVFGIAFGLGVMASGFTIISAFAAQFPRSVLMSRLAPPIAFHAAVMIWVFYALRTEPAARQDTAPPHHPELRRWNDALAEMLNR